MSDETTVASDEEQEAPAAVSVEQAPGSAATPTKADEQPDLTPEELIAALEASFRDFKDGDIVEGEVVKIDRDEVLLDIGYKSEGVIPSKELSIRHDVDPSQVVKVGDRIEAAKPASQTGTAPTAKHGEGIEHDSVAHQVEHRIDLLCFGDMLREVRPLDLAAHGAELLQHRETVAAAGCCDHPHAGVDGHLERSLAEG